MFFSFKYIASAGKCRILLNPLHLVKITFLCTVQIIQYVGTVWKNMGTVVEMAVLCRLCFGTVWKNMSRGVELAVLFR